MRRDMMRAAQAQGATLACMKKVAILEKWFQNDFLGLTDPVVVVATWREAKPCYGAWLGSALSSRLVCIIVQPDSFKAFHSASQWAKCLPPAPISVVVLPVTASRPPYAIVQAATRYAAAERRSSWMPMPISMVQGATATPSTGFTSLTSHAGSSVSTRVGSDSGSECPGFEVVALLQAAGFIDAKFGASQTEGISNMLASAVPDCYYD